MFDEEDAEWRTTFEPDDAPPTDRLDESEGRREHYRRLAVTNTLGWNGKWRSEKKVTDKSERGLFDSICSSLELTDFQQKRAWKYYQQFPKSYRKGYPVSIQLLVACAYSGWKDGRNYRPIEDDEQRDKEQISDDITQIIDDIDGNMREFRSIWFRLMGEIDV